MRKLTLLFLLVIMLSVTATAQSCPSIVESALDAVDEVCEDAGRNQACYGNIDMDAEPQPGISDFAFDDVGDIEDVGKLQSLELSPLDEDAGIWGVALMRLQADIPDTLPGQNVTFLLFGDVEIVNDVSPGDPGHPMEAFYLRTGIGDAGCDEAPESGLLVQTPDGVEQVAFNVNGVDVSMGSTVFFQAQPGREMRVSTVEGAAVMTIDGETHAAIAGTRLRVPIDDDLRPIGPPPPPESYDDGEFNALPVRTLDRPIDIAPPLPPEPPPCPPGDDCPRPPDDDRPCVYPPRPGDPPLPEWEDRPFCDEPDGPPPDDDRPCVYPPQPGDPPLPEWEDRPFCPEPTPPPPPDDGVRDGDSVEDTSLLPTPTYDDGETSR